MYIVLTVSNTVCIYFLDRISHLRMIKTKRHSVTLLFALVL